MSVVVVVEASFEEATDTSTTIRSRNPPPNLGLSNHTTTHYFTYLLDAGFLTLAIPFRPVLDRKSKEYVVGSNYFQSSLCYTVWILSFLFRLTVLRQMWTLANDDTTTDSASTIPYFNLAHATFHLLVYVSFYRSFYTHKDKIIELLNEIIKSPVFTVTSSNAHASLPVSNLVPFTRVYLLSSQLAWVALTIASPILGYTLLSCTCNWTWDELINTYVVHGRYTLFLSGSFRTLASDALEVTDDNLPGSGQMLSLTVADKLIGSFQALVTASNFIVLFFTVTVFGNCAVTLWAGASAFKDMLFDKSVGMDEQESVGKKTEDQESEKWWLVDSSFRSLSSISDKVNRIWHVMVFVYVLDIMSWLSTELDRGLRTHDWVLKLDMFYAIAYMGAALLFSAEACRKIQWIREALVRKTTRRRDTSGCESEFSSQQYKESHTNGTQVSFVDIIQATRRSNIGLGSTGFYRINYSFIGKVVVLIITFFIISVQYGESNRTMDEDPMFPDPTTSPPATPSSLSRTTGVFVGVDQAIRR